MYRLGFFLRRIYWFLFRPKTSGTKCAIEYRGKYLLIRNTYGKRIWTFPGGGIEKGESPENSIRREIKEELSITLGPIEVMGTYLTTRNFKRDMVRCFYSRVDVSDFTTDPKEILEAGWFSLDEVPPYRTPGADNIIAMLESRMNMPKK